MVRPQVETDLYEVQMASDPFSGPKYYRIDPLRHGFARVVVAGAETYLDRDGKLLWSPETNGSSNSGKQP